MKKDYQFDQAISDLNKSVPRMFCLLRSDKTVREFVSILLVRQMLTGMKNIKGLPLIRFYKVIFFCLLRSRSNGIRSIVGAAFFVIGSLLRTKISSHKFSNLSTS